MAKKKLSAEEIKHRLQEHFDEETLKIREKVVKDLTILDVLRYEEEQRKTLEGKCHGNN